MAIKYYLDTDLRSKKIYIAPFEINKEHLYLIQTPDRYTGEKILKALIIGKIKSPIESKDSYDLIEIKNEKFGNLVGKVYIYELKIKI